ncbi:hypothetical protein HANVADRAFT_53348 [Hanseniaspora valbyensis NRRL Y-1626]|uniref:HotDog ACOT-type domain-containing protein n=1 Tax=Hanseniaspora valbyensis NRRL Y-1626 TaxID=766949 RepID=A0A1B7TBS0_9ASCO|nr:hypothetical protein HANVADRAFT_53348 [Hanseniaspora valbyensis NRRL Y-1626]
MISSSLSKRTSSQLLKNNKLSSLSLNRFKSTNIASSSHCNSKKAAQSAQQPDANATVSAELYDYHRLSRIGQTPGSSNPENTKEAFKATWLNAINERMAQLKQGKIIDSYMYNNVKSTAILEKTRDESFSYLLLPFATDPTICDFYTNSNGNAKCGQFFMDLDALAGRIAYRHCAPSEPILVTACVDRVYMMSHLDNIQNRNVVLSGSVCWTGKSSMEIEVTATSFDKSIELPKEITQSFIKDCKLPHEKVLSSTFTFVARNPETHKSLAINKILPASEQDWIDYKRAESYNIAKKMKAKQEQNDNSNLISSTGLSEEESKIVHNLWKLDSVLKDNLLNPISGKPIKDNIKFAKDTQLTSTIIVQPQYRNRHSFQCFGGALMKWTFELAYCTACSVSNGAPRFMSLDATTFKAPVPIGSILHMNSKVVYSELHNYKPDESDDTELCISKLQHLLPAPITGSCIPSINKVKITSGTILQVKVDTKVQHVQSQVKKQTGSFVYSFFVPNENEEGTIQKFQQDLKFIEKPGYSIVLPETYTEFIDFLEARRRYEETVNYAEQQLRSTK